MKKGEVMGLEQRAKISASLMGHPVSAETRKKSGASNVGRPTANLALCNNQAAHKWCDSEEAKIFFGR